MQHGSCSLLSILRLFNNNWNHWVQNSDSNYNWNEEMVKESQQIGKKEVSI